MDVWLADFIKFLTSNSHTLAVSHITGQNNATRRRKARDRFILLFFIEWMQKLYIYWIYYSSYKALTNSR